MSVNRKMAKEELKNLQAKFTSSLIQKLKRDQP